MKPPRIELLPEKKLAGKRLRMSHTHNRTYELWNSFMPRRKEIAAANHYLYSVEVYDPDYFRHFSMEREFDKWAAVEVNELGAIPEGMEGLLLPEGLYAVFLHKGPASEGPLTYNYIFGEWLPQSAYVLDQRPHFALMGEKYRNNDPDSEEELWVPVKAKG